MRQLKVVTDDNGLAFISDRQVSIAKALEKLYPLARHGICGKYDLLKIPCRHAIKAGFFVGREPYTLTDFLYTTGAWREAYQESINPISVPEDGWSVPQVVENSEVLPPETRRSLGRNRKRRYETVEDKIRSAQGSQGDQLRKCSRCGLGGHNRATCKMPI